MGAKLEQVGEAVRVQVAGSDSIYDGWGANQGVVSTSAGAVVIDTGFTVPASVALARAVRRSSSPCLRMVVNTHDHSDHVFGNSVLAESEPLFLAHANCRSRLVELGRRRIAGYRRMDRRLRASMTGLHIVPPQATYETDFELTVGRTLFRFVHPGHGAHTSGDTMVFLPDEKLLFAGDVVWSAYHPNLEDANIEGWLRALSDIAKMDVETIVPGHGPVSNKGCVKPLARYLGEFDSGLKELVRDGVPKKKVAESLRLPDTGDWSLRPIIARNIDILYDKYLGQSSA